MNCSTSSLPPSSSRLATYSNLVPISSFPFAFPNEKLLTPLPPSPPPRLLHECGIWLPVFDIFYIFQRYDPFDFPLLHACFLNQASEFTFFHHFPDWFDSSIHLYQRFVPSRPSPVLESITDHLPPLQLPSIIGTALMHQATGSLFSTFIRLSTLQNAAQILFFWPILPTLPPVDSINTHQVSISPPRSPSLSKAFLRMQNKRIRLGRFVPRSVRPLD